MVYTLSPIDLIPDFIPILGLIDDIIILPILIKLVIRLIPNKLWEECLQEAKNLWIDGKPKKMVLCNTICNDMDINIIFCSKIICVTSLRSWRNGRRAVFRRQYPKDVWVQIPSAAPY